MSSLTNLLDSIGACKACRLMQENKSIDIPHIPILPKPAAQFMFVGRDPSPRTAMMIGVRGGKSVFINEIFKITDWAGIPEDKIYITDICKCHWRTSAGVPLPNTEHRSSKLDKSIMRTCLNKWLLREIEILNPRLIVSFGEEMYQFLRPFITNPIPSPRKLSAKADKSVLDAEYWFVNNGPFTLNISGTALTFAFIRHAGNSRRLPLSTSTDKRLKFYDASIQKTIQLLQESSI